MVSQNAFFTSTGGYKTSFSVETELLSIIVSMVSRLIEMRFENVSIIN